LDFFLFLTLSLYNYFTSLAATIMLGLKLTCFKIPLFSVMDDLNAVTVRRPPLGA
jgi:hypothetical protein